MTIMACVCSPPADCDCSLQEALADLLSDAPAFASVQVYTGGLASTCATNDTGPTLPYVVLLDLGANNSVRFGENLTQHFVTVTADYYTTSEKLGRSLARAAMAAWTPVDGICTEDGFACLLANQGRPVSRQLPGCVWQTRMNYSLLVHESIS